MVDNLGVDKGHPRNRVQKHRSAPRRPGPILDTDGVALGDGTGRVGDVVVDVEDVAGKRSIRAVKDHGDGVAGGQVRRRLHGEHRATGRRRGRGLQGVR